MKAKKVIETIVLSACLVGFSACSTTELDKLAELGGTQEIDIVAMDGGAVIVDTITITATVTGKESEKRKVTLTSEQGEVTIKTRPDMPNYDQIEVGDEVEVLLTEEMVLFIGRDAPASSAAASSMAFAPDGQKPEAYIMDTQMVTVEVVAVDAQAHKVTFKLADGSTEEVKVDDKLDLSGIAIGEDLTVVVRESFSLSVEAGE